jgi:anaerobic dimethyl sulfoxide reductase subunit B (iron-sulfur subunit)
MRALEFGPLNDLIEKFGRIRELEDMPSGKLTRPSVVFKPSQSKRQIIHWDMERAMDLWKKREPLSRELTDLFESVKDLTEIPPGTIGRGRLVLKAKKSEELMYYTTDDD